MSPESFAALGAIMSGSEIAVLFTPEAVTAPAGFKFVLAESGEQMIGTPAQSAIDGVQTVTLGADDVPEMMALTELTKPGPFSARTHELGTFLGIRIDGELVAMAGERMKPANYTEMTAVCVHPSHRGRGYGQLLLGAISRQIVARGEIPFLHVFSSNASAIALYRRQGMEIRRRLHVTVLQKRATVDAPKPLPSHSGTGSCHNPYSTLRRQNIPACPSSTSRPTAGRRRRPSASRR